MSLFRTEQQYIFDIDLQRVYEIYSSLWRKILIPRKFLFVTNKSINEDDKEILQKEIEDGHLIMYRQNNIVVVDFKTRRRTITDRMDPMELSAQFNTTVLDYSNWEDQSVVIASRGKKELSIFTDYNATLEIGSHYTPKFDKLVAKLKNIKGDQMHKLSEIEDLLGSDLENIFKIIGVDLISISELDINKVQEAVTYDVFAKW